MLLETYVYLRNADAKGFYHEKLTESLWKRMEEVSQFGGTEPLLPEADGGLEKCSTCKSRVLHERVHAKHRRSECPFSSLSNTKARAATKELLALLDTDPSYDVAAGIHALLAKYK